MNKFEILDKIDDWYINHLAKNLVFAVVHSRVSFLQKCVTQIISLARVIKRTLSS